MTLSHIHCINESHRATSIFTQFHVRSSPFAGWAGREVVGAICSNAHGPMVFCVKIRCKAYNKLTSDLDNELRATLSVRRRTYQFMELGELNAADYHSTEQWWFLAFYDMIALSYIFFRCVKCGFGNLSNSIAH